MINIPDKIKVGFFPNSIYISKGEIAPIGKTKPELKKINNLSKYPVIQEHDNIPLPGFIIDDFDDYSNTGRWEIIDPRGFRIPITDHNLMKLLLWSSTNNGLIGDRCVWTRDNNDTKMSLTPISDPNINNIVNNRKLLDNIYKIKDINIGDMVETTDDIFGQYMGKFFIYRMHFTSDINKGLMEYSVSLPITRHIIKEDNYCYHIINPQIHTLKRNNILTIEESKKLINIDVRHTNILNSSLSVPVYFTDSYCSEVKVNIIGITLEKTSGFNVHSVGNVYISDDIEGNYYLMYPNSLSLSGKCFLIINIDYKNGKIIADNQVIISSSINIKNSYHIIKHISDTEKWI